MINGTLPVNNTEHLYGIDATDAAELYQFMSGNPDYNHFVKPRVVHKAPNRGEIMAADIGDMISPSIAVMYGLKALGALGGAKGIIELLKCYLQYRNGREIVLVRGDVSVTLKGDVTQTQIAAATRLLEANSNKLGELKAELSTPDNPEAAQ